MKIFNYSNKNNSQIICRLVCCFKALLIILILAYTTQGAFDRFVELADSENPLRNRIVFLIVFILCIYSVIVSAYIDSLFIRILFATVVAIATFSSQSYLDVTHTIMSYGDLYSLWIARDDWKSALFNYWSSVLVALGVAITLWIVIVWPVRFDHKKYRITRWGKYLFPIPFLLIGLMIAKKGGAAAIGFPEQVRAVAMFEYVVYFDFTNDFDRARKLVDIYPLDDKPRPNLVLIIDESVRGDFISINNPAAKTTPFLESQLRLIANFGYASSTHDCSHYANANIRYGSSSDDPATTLLTGPSIWEFAKKAGYQTTYIDAQRRHGQLQNFMSPRERRSIDNFVQFSDVDAVERSDAFVHKDQRAAELLRVLLAKNKPQFVILNKEGAHAPYEGKYPKSEKRFMPTMDISDSITLSLPRNKIINSYRNAIYWGVDKFFQVLLVDPEIINNSLIFYTGDHGQNLLNDGVITHCGSPHPPNVVGLVPLFVITNQSDYKNKIQVAANYNFNKASHFNIFPTLLYLMGFDKKDYSGSYEDDLTEELSGNRIWFYGDVINKSSRRQIFKFDPSEAEPKE